MLQWCFLWDYISEMATFQKRANMKFCFKFGKTADETYKILQKVYGETAVTKRLISSGSKDFEKEMSL